MKNNIKVFATEDRKDAFSVLAWLLSSNTMTSLKTGLDGFIKSIKDCHFDPYFNYKTVRYVGSMSYENMKTTKEELFSFLQYIIEQKKYNNVRWMSPYSSEDFQYPWIKVTGKDEHGEHMFVRIIYTPEENGFINFVCGFHPSYYTDYEKSQPEWWY